MQPEEKKEVEHQYKPLRTYQGDIAEALAKNGGSQTTVFVAEQKRKLASPEPEKPLEEVDTRKRNKIFIWSGVTLFFLGIISISVVYYIKSINEVILIQKTKALIAFTEEKILPVAKGSSTRTDTLGQIVLLRDSFKSPINSVRYINTGNATGTPTDVTELLSIITPQMPGSLSRSFEKEYMLGVYSLDTDEVFMIFKTKDFASSYSGMLEWEKTMVKDIGSLFEIDPNTASSTTFFDEEMQNKDIRALKENAGSKTILLYSFIDRETLVITKSERILSAIIGKYQISKQSR